MHKLPIEKVRAEIDRGIADLSVALLDAKDLAPSSASRASIAATPSRRSSQSVRWSYSAPTRSQSDRNFGAL
jgi:hypothetical protein